MKDNCSKGSRQNFNMILCKHCRVAHSPQQESIKSPIVLMLNQAAQERLF